VDARVRSWKAYPIAAAAAAFITGAAVFAGMAVAVPLRGETVLVALWCVLCSCAVGVAAWRLGPLFGVPLAIVAALAIDSFYIAPYRTFDSRDWVNYPVTAMYIAIGVLVGGILEITRRRAATSETARSRLAEEQAALRRVATLIAQGPPPDEVFDAVAAKGTAPRPWWAEPGPTTGRARSGGPSRVSRPQRFSGPAGPLGSMTTAESRQRWRPAG
jgi:K+-sensing histidine kinase KdpD